MKQTKLFVSLILLGVVLLFVVQNLAAVELTFLVWSVSLSQALLLLLVFVCGLTIGVLLTTLAGRKTKRTPPDKY
ncbi:MAG: LapA family protein [Desulfuromonadales bacterium]|nr:LapA family protein [Desulfuromonadales bacterium]MDT8423546.1 LapA family protein [Desulfuromonadales bacterium]